MKKATINETPFSAPKLLSYPKRRVVSELTTIEHPVILNEPVLTATQQYSGRNAPLHWCH